MNALIKEAADNFEGCAGRLQEAAESSPTELVQAGVIEVLAKQLNAGTSIIDVANIASTLYDRSEIKPYDMPGLLAASCNCMLKLALKGDFGDEFSYLMNPFTNLVWRFEDEEGEKMMTALAEAGLSKPCMELIRRDGPDSERIYSVLINLSNTQDAAPPMVRDGCHTFIAQRMKDSPRSVWENDEHETDGGRAFDVATNLAKWASIRDQLIKAGYVEALADLVNYDNYFGFESTEGLAYIVGRSEEAKNVKLLQAKERNVQIIFEVLEGSLDGNPYRFGIHWSIYGRVLALQNLSVSDGNKKLLKPAIPLLFRVVAEHGSEDRSVELALQTLLELSFNEANKNDIMALPDVKDTVMKFTNSPNPSISQYAKSLSFVLAAKKPPAPAAAASTSNDDTWVMISYHEKDRALIQAFNEMLKQNGVKTWVDFEKGTGDPVEMMASAVEGAKVLVVCLSEAYKESGTCRLEANYAFKNRKPIIPLLMQEGYSPHGWLGLLIGNALYYPIFNEDMITSAAGRILGEIGKQGNDANAAAAAQRLAAAGPQKRNSVTGDRRPSAAGKPPPPASGLVSATVGGIPFVGCTFPAAALVSMPPADIEAWMTAKGDAKLGLSLKKAGVTGSTLGMVFDSLCRGDSSAMAICKDLGCKSAGQSLEFLYFVRELCLEKGAVKIYGPAFPAKLQNMNSTQIVEWLNSKGHGKLATAMAKQGITGKGMAILLDMYNRSDPSVYKTCSDLGSASTAQTLGLLYTLKESGFN